MRTTTTPLVEESGRRPATIDVTPPQPPMFQAVNLPAYLTKKFNKFLNFVEENPDHIAKNEQKVMIVEGKTLEGSNFDDLISNIYVHNNKYNLIGIQDFSQPLSKANLSKSVISNSTLKQLKSPQKHFQFHTPALSTQRSPSHQTPQKKGPNVGDIAGYNRRYQGNGFAHIQEPWLPPQKEVPGFSLVDPLKSYWWKTSSSEQWGKGKRTPSGKRPRMLKLYR